MTEVLTAAQLKRLTEHKYSATGTSICEPVMQPFWKWLVEQIPLWWAPNAITLTGLAINVLTTCLLILYSPDAQAEPAAWVLFLAAVGLFIYQSLDAMDGKQARRTKQCTPLGELFDHGCDSVSTVFVCIGTCIALQLGRVPSLFFIEAFATMLLFYTAHWQTYCTGTLKFGKIDVTEAQFCVMLSYVLSGMFGASVWNLEIPLLGYELRILPVIISASVAVLASQMYFSIIFMEGGVGKNGSTVAGTSVLSPIVPAGIVTIMAFIIWQKSPSHVYENHPVLYILSFGMVFAKITNKLVVAHMTKSEMDLFDTSFIGPGMLFLNQYFNTVLSEYIVLWMCCIYCALDLLRYSVLVCIQICDYLNIYCFKITPPDKAKGTEHVRGSASNTSSSASSTTSASYTTNGSGDSPPSSSAAGGVMTRSAAKNK